MKKLVLPLALLCFVGTAAKADVVYSDTFNYVNGSLIAVGTNGLQTNWFRHSGTASPSDSFVNNHRLEVASSSPGAVPRTDDVHCNFSSFTNTQTILYGSLTVRCTNLPPAVGTYFAHFYANTTTFHCRVYAQAGSLPNTWRLGIAGVAGTVNKVYPVDLALNTDYQVVVQWDPVSLFAATLWVNPTNSTDLSFTSSDAVTSPAASVGFGFRQAGTFGNAFFTISNLVVATTFDDASTNAWSPTPVPPVVAYQPVGGTNFVGDPVTVTAVAAGQGISSLTFQWQKNGANIANPNGNTNVFSFTASGPSDSGNYRMIATTPYGLSATSAVAFLWITNAPIPPTITVQPGSTNAFYHQTISLVSGASGPPPISFQWYYNNAPATGGNVSGADSDTITISDIFTNNGTTGAYYLVASNPFGSKTSSIANVTVSGPPAVSIAYLRSLVDGNYIATNSNLRWQATGVVTTATNVTSSDTSSYYIQDGTGGINIFTTHGHDIRFTQGQIVSFVGWLSSFNSTLELEGDTNDTTTGFSVIGTNAALPAPKVIPFNITNNLAASEALESSVVMLTNVFFGTNAGTTISSNANQAVLVTNAAGETFTLFFAPQVLDTAGQTLPSFAYSVVGVLNQNLGNAISPRNSGYQVAITRFSDIITDAPPAAVSVLCPKCVCCPPPLTGSDQNVISWSNVAWDNANFSYASNYSYTVLASTNVTGPYTPVNYYKAELRGLGENPPNITSGTGFGTVVLSPDQTKITVTLSFSGLTGPATASHIHGPGGVGTNASVLFPFTGVPAATSGTIPQQTFSITPTQLGYLTNGFLYMNVHTAANPGGEIRDQLRITSSVGLTFANSSLTNTAATTATFTDPNNSGIQKYYRVVSP